MRADQIGERVQRVPERGSLDRLADVRHEGQQDARGGPPDDDQREERSDGRAEPREVRPTREVAGREHREHGDIEQLVEPNTHVGVGAQKQQEGPSQGKVIHADPP